MRVVAVIPAFNVEKTIKQVVNASKQYCDEVVVVNDNSADSTPRIIQELSIRYAWHSKNYGQGAATRTGMKIAMNLGADIIITLDGDGQHNPSEMPRVLKPILSNKADVVIGSRFIKAYKIPRYRKFGIDIINWLYNTCNGKRLVDTQSCFRAYSRQLIERLVIEEDGFGFSTEVLVKMRKVGARIAEVPVSCIYHDKLEMNSTLNPIKHGLIVAWKTLWWRVKLWN